MRDRYGKTRFLTQAGLIAAVYTALCLLLQPVSFGFGGVQLRVAEALTILPVLMPAAVPGLAVGCLLSNILGGAALLDVAIGTLTTLAAALLTRRLREKPLLAAAPPVLLNAVTVGSMLKYVYGVNLPLLLCMASVGAGQLAACYGLGMPMLKALKRAPKKYFMADTIVKSNK